VTRAGIETLGEAWVVAAWKCQAKEHGLALLQSERGSLDHIIGLREIESWRPYGG
jgi:hypothetical protein